LLASPADGDKTVGDRFLEAAIEASKKGDFRFFKEIFDRHDGPVPTATSDAKVDVTTMTDDQLDDTVDGKG
jgi:hypothetical protein